MKPIVKKVLVGLLVLLVSVFLFFVYVAYRIGQVLGVAETFVFDRFVSPDKQREIVVYNEDCGATCGIVYNFAITKFSANGSNTRVVNFFYIDPPGSEDVQYSVKWLDDWNVEILANDTWRENRGELVEIEGVKIVLK